MSVDRFRSLSTLYLFSILCQINAGMLCQINAVTKHYNCHAIDLTIDVFIRLFCDV